MFRRLMLAGQIAGALLLGACAALPSGSTASQIQQYTVLACGFLPTIQTVEGIIAAGNPLLATGNAIANAICAAVVPTKSARLRATVPTVNGVVVHGRFVR